MSNINVGLLGHVDSGKTSLSKALSDCSSTAAFDKNPQSQERGITLDLGFSRLKLDDDLTFTFVDCPGHASLMKTVIGGSAIIDMILLLIDVNKGFETQTSECLILAEISKRPTIIVLNKIDMIEDSKKEATLEKVTRKIQKTLSPTVFSNSKIIPVSALQAINTDVLKQAMVDEVVSMKLQRKKDLPFIFAFDHCFNVKGSGTVLSGTVLQGAIKINDTFEIPKLKEAKKVKSIQIFRKNVDYAEAGDRCGLCVTNFNAKLLERGLACEGGTCQDVLAVIVKFNKIKYFKRSMKSKEKFHCSVGHETAMGKVTIFSSTDQTEFSWNQLYKYEESLEENSDDQRNYFALIEFEHQVMVHDGMLLIASKLDAEQKNACRLCFHGNILLQNSSSDKNYTATFLPSLKIYKNKSRSGQVQRVVNDREVIADNLFKKETDRTKFLGLEVKLSTGEKGKLAGSFGQSSKVRIQFLNSLSASTLDILKLTKDKVTVTLTFKKFIFDKDHKMVQ